MYRLEKARVEDAPRLQALVARYAAQDVMLPRTVESIVQTLPDWVVAAAEAPARQVIGGVCLTTLAPELAEVRSLVAVYDEIADDLVTPTVLTPFASVFYPRNEAGQLVMSLRRMAGSAIFRLQIPQVVDPEGYLRQRMTATHARLTNTADLIMDAAEAYSYY